MSNNKTEYKKAVESARKDDLTSDASYRVKKNSLAPAGEGAFHGLLASGAGARLIGPKSRIGEAAIMAAGSTIGAGIGHAKHKKKLKDKEKARALLNKTSGDEDSGLFRDTATGAAIGGGLSALFPGNVSRSKWGIAGAVAGAASGAVSNLATRGYNKLTEGHNERGENPSFAAPLAIAGAGAAMAEPAAYKLFGKANKGDKTLEKSLKKDIRLSNKKGMWNSISRGLGGQDSARSAIEGVRQTGKGKFFDKKMGMRTLTGGLRGGALMYGAGTILDKLVSGEAKPKGKPSIKDFESSLMTMQGKQQNT